MKKTILTLVATTFALTGAMSCTDYLYDGTIDLGQSSTDEPTPEEPFEYPSSYTYNHPCALVSAADIARVQAHVAAADAADPVYASWQHLCSNSYAQAAYTPNPQEILVRGDVTGTGVDRENYINADRDAAAAFQLALRYCISGDKQYADTAVKILNAWTQTCKRITANDANYQLLAGFQGYQFANAGELLRDYEGWNNADQNLFKQWLLELWYPINYAFINEHGGSNVCDLHYWSNWELANLASILSIGIYTENKDMVNFVYRNFREGSGSGALNNMIPYDPVEDTDVAGCMIAQNMESGRDQGHATLVVAVCAELCQMAWNVGIDFFGMENNKVLAMAEYTAKWNARPAGAFLTETMPFKEYKYCYGECGCRDHNHGALHTEVANDGGRGTVRPGWDLLYNHYAKIKNADAAEYHYTQIFAEQLRSQNGQLTGDGGAGDARYGSNSSAFDQIGWGTLLFSLD